LALIDVSELLVDPDFVDAISLITRTSTPNTYGENTLSESTVVSVGSVQPAAGKTVRRLPEQLQTANVSSFWFKGEIKTTDGGTTYPMILVFKGKRYQVQMVFDWTNFGQGWSEGVCIAEAIA
jgi:hypothetical protein